MRSPYLCKNIKPLARIAVVGVAACFCTLFPQNARAKEALSWGKVLAVYDAYVDFPCPNNARALLEALPTDWPNEMIGDSSWAMKHIQSIDNFPVLYEEFISGDRTAVEIYFRLLNIADGFFLQTLLTNLGWIARDKPRLFLDVLLTYKDARQVIKYGYTVTFVGSGHNIHPKAAVHILERRLEALEAVEGHEYEGIKGVCISKLHEAIEIHKKLSKR